MLLLLVLESDLWIRFGDYRLFIDLCWFWTEIWQVRRWLGGVPLCRRLLLGSFLLDVINASLLSFGLIRKFLYLLFRNYQISLLLLLFSVGFSTTLRVFNIDKIVILLKTIISIFFIINVGSRLNIDRPARVSILYRILPTSWNRYLLSLLRLFDNILVLAAPSTLRLHNFRLIHSLSFLMINRVIRQFTHILCRTFILLLRLMYTCLRACHIILSYFTFFTVVFDWFADGDFSFEHLWVLRGLVK